MKDKNYNKYNKYNKFNSNQVYELRQKKTFKHSYKSSWLLTLIKSLSLILCSSIFCFLSTASNTYLYASTEDDDEFEYYDSFVGDNTFEIASINFEGNVRVADSAILNVMQTKIKDKLDQQKLANDIKSIYALGYFFSVELSVNQLQNAHKPSSEAHKVIVDVNIKLDEKPAITKISFQSISDNDAEEIKKTLKTKLHQILSEKNLSADLGTINSFYQSSGYFMAESDYKIKNISDNEVEVIFTAKKGNKVFISNVSILGNHFIADSTLLQLMQSRPFDRMQNFRSPYYSDQAVSSDQQLIQFYYQDNGYAEASVDEAIKIISADKSFIDLIFFVSEGKKYHFSEVSFSGDLLFDEQKLNETLDIKSNDLFRISKLKSGVDNLIDIYGDLGYAFVDVMPDTKIDKDNEKIALHIKIIANEKAYIGNIDILGNNKTRDNVIRRELTITDGQLYSRKKLRESERNISRLGYFDSVKLIRKPDAKDKTLLHYTLKVEEKSTGMVQASVGYSPGGEVEANWFAQGKYEEKNQSGRGWTLGLQGTFSDPKTYSVGSQFFNPRINDSSWSLSFGVNRQKRNIISLGFDVLETQNTFYTNTGRKIFELIRGSLGFEFTQSVQDSSIYLSNHLLLSGNTIGITTSLSRSDVDDYIDPTSGNSFSILQRFVGGPLGGDYSFVETEANVRFYYPIMFFDSFPTHFKITGNFAMISSFFGSAPPLFERYRLGGPFDLRGYAPNSISPKFVLWRSPYDLDQQAYYPKGGDRKIVFQIEYYMPLLTQLKMKSLVFADAGRVFDNNQDFTLKDMFYDVGFGIRWVTPMGPLRFEWAFPVNSDGTLGPYKIVFNIGY